MTNLRAVSEWMTEDVAWMELLDLERAGFHYNLEEKMIKITVCKDCGGYKMVSKPKEIGFYHDTADDCSSPCTCPDEEKDIGEAAKEYDRICRSRPDKYDTTCLKCGGLVARPGVVYGYTGKFCCCPDEDNQPNIDMGDYEYDPVAKIRFMKPNNLEKMIGEYASYGKQEIRFCPYCGSALGML